VEGASAWREAYEASASRIEVICAADPAGWAVQVTACPECAVAEVVVHVAATDAHAGHADIIRESLDGARTMG
jgi:hypothetical protein